MKANKTLSWVGIGLLALAAAPAISFAQAGAFGGGFGPPLKAEPPPKQFASSEEHYKYLLEQAKGGTKHTLATVPRWDGLWNTAGNTHMEAFIEGPGLQGGKVREGVLTPEYEVAYKERWRQQMEDGQVNYDRLVALRAARDAALPARALHARVHQPARESLPDQRFRPVDPPRAASARSTATSTARTPGTATRSGSGTATSSSRTPSTCCPPTSRAGRR